MTNFNYTLQKLFMCEGINIFKYEGPRLFQREIIMKLRKYIDLYLQSHWAKFNQPCQKAFFGKGYSSFHI